MISEIFHDKGTKFKLGFPGKVPAINCGKAVIYIHTNKDFVSALSRNHKLIINFRLVVRKTDGIKVYDVGFYQVSVSTSKEILTNYGKFAVVFFEEKDQRWKFLTGINSPASQ